MSVDNLVSWCVNCVNMFQEEEDGLEEEDSDSDDNSAKETDNQGFNDKWRQTVVKDLTRWQGSVISRCDSLDQVLDTSDDGGKDGVKLSLKEIGHIRRVLARAELETDNVSSGLRYDLDNGRVCGVCTLTRFGVLTRGWPCDLCSVVSCSGCIDTASRLDTDTVYNIGDIPRHLLAPNTDHPSDTPHNCAGSAPNSPPSHRKHDHASGVEPLSLPPLQPPPVTSRSTLPRRWSMMVRPRHQDNITMCLHCKNMIKQVTTRKSHDKHQSVSNLPALL